MAGARLLRESGGAGGSTAARDARRSGAAHWTTPGRSGCGMVMVGLFSAERERALLALELGPLPLVPNPVEG